MADHQEVLANFVAITGADAAEALPCLEATNWELEEAVSLFFASNDGHGATGARAGADDFPSIPPEPEDEVRAPIPTKVERLYGNQSSDPRALAAMSAAQYGINQQRHAAPVDVFRDFKAEGKQAEGKGTTSGLSQMFQPPKELLFMGDFEMAKMRAGQEGKWLLLNIQAQNEFDSHRLNRDTWTCDGLKELLTGMFLFCQYDESIPEGRRLATMYKTTRLPVVMVVDPITGAKLYLREGFVGAEKLIEDLVPFMDHGPNDPGAGQMAHSMNLKRKAQEEAALRSAAVEPAAMSEDEQMARAIAMSMAQDGSSGAGAAGASSSKAADLDEDVDEAAVWEAIRKQEEKEQHQAAVKTPEQVRDEAAARLPPEPAESSSSACRVAFRLPDGSRTQRRFEKTDTVQALMDFCITVTTEVAAGAQFDIVPTLPGAQPLTDPAQTIQVAGVANSMLAVKLR